MAAIYFSALFIGVINSQCLETLPSGWTESYCPEDITRIEYQIPIDHRKLTANSANTVDQIDSALKWIYDNFQQDKYLGEFRLKTSKIKKYYRDVTQLNINKNGNNAIKAPKSSSLKYRQTFDVNGQAFQNTDSFGLSAQKFQNDLTFGAAMSTQGQDLDYLQVAVESDYSAIYGYKLEPNVFVDTCTKADWDLYIYGSETTGFSGKIEFDDDETIVPDDTHGPVIVDTSQWSNADDVDAFYCGECSDTNSCICCDIEQFFPDYCSYFDQSSTTKNFRYNNYVDYVLDIDFFWYKNGDYVADADPEIAETSEGKFTFQVHYNTKTDQQNDNPVKRATEFSVKLYKKDTIDGEWDNLLEFAEDLIDNLVFPPDDIPPNEWIDYTVCECEHNGNGINQLNRVCPRQQTKAACEATGNGNCQWVTPTTP